MDDNESPLSDADRRVVQRLAAFASAPLDPDLAARCVGRLRRRARPERRTARSLLLVAAVVTALLVASAGLAAADTLPDSVQDVAHRALDTVGVHVPPGHDRYNDPAVCPGGPYQNHGAYVRSHKDDPNAGSSPCGKPVKSTQHTDGSDTEDDSGTTGEGNGGTHGGPPPWAHGHPHEGKGDKKTKEQKQGATGDDEHDAPAGNAPAPSTTSVPPTASTTIPTATTTAPTTTVPDSVDTTTETTAPS